MKVLVIRFSSLGDVLLTTPVLRCLKKQKPDCHIHFLTKSSNFELLYKNPNIEKIFVLQDSIKQTVKSLAEEKYDLVIDLHNNRRSRRVRNKLRCKNVVYRKENIHKWLTILTKHDWMSGRHVVQRYMQAVENLGVVDDGAGLDLFLPEEVCGEAFKTRTIGKYTIASITDRPYVAVPCGAQHETKRIPLDKLMILTSLIKTRVVLLGDKSDKHRIRDWGAQFGPNVVNLCGKTSLLESAALIRDAAAVVTPDSAMMHVAAAFKKPLIAVWGATKASFGFAPFRTPHIDCRVSGLWCRPCSRMGTTRCPLGHFKCMNNQNWQSIANAATQMALQEIPAGHNFYESMTVL
jgi:lipopolysaccharide heptosyltransferase II